MIKTHIVVTLAEFRKSITDCSVRAPLVAEVHSLGNAVSDSVGLLGFALDAWSFSIDGFSVWSCVCLK